ncbi:class I SAM-dependent methyltransferase [Luteolibacter luteus]|uniref:Class I SAM-dependent methyltransferase n=1 Tax=Luteolibacter luteus TaxID=2728835 RepID=A0A858RK61_9BACT|nr:class I SAM-dependent methyltransferase [Luteolibacter luteus]QJE97115.1 class I SAM-dependent methyltransferase [Luteolibacter luteus]
MSDDADFATNIKRFTGFAGHYDAFRPTLPEALSGLLLEVARAHKSSTVVDLGSGTGLSTRYWSGKVREVIGIEPTDAMREEAERHGGAGVSYRRGFSHDTGLPDGSASIVVCSQALHWMDPQGTFKEAKRILRPGGVFAACDYDWPPVTGVWELDQAYQACDQRGREMERAHALSEGIKFQEKSGHLDRMRSSGAFRWTREVLLHHEEQGDAARLVGLLFSQGSVQTVLKAGFNEADMGIDRFRELATALMPQAKRWLWCSRVRIGVV